MSRASEAIRAHDGRWSPIGASEVLEAARLAKEVACGSQTREAQAMQAYMFLASIRDSERLTAIASNAEVAAHVLTKDGSGTISGASYRRYTKNDLRLCGLVDFPSSKGGREAATVYTFPAFMRLYGIVDNSGATAREPAKPCTSQLVQNTYDLYGLTGTKHAQKVASIELLKDRGLGMEEGYSIHPQENPSPVVENPRPQQQQSRPRHGNAKVSFCPKCGDNTRFRQREGTGFFTCTRCGVYRCFLPDD